MGHILDRKKNWTLNSGTLIRFLYENNIKM